MMGDFDDIMNALILDQQARSLGTKIDTGNTNDDDDE
jgi:hypothetical protein